MVPLLAGAGLLLVLLGAADAFSRAEVPTIRSLLAWIAALGGLSLGLLLVLSGRWPAAIAALVMFGPLGWQWWRGRHAGPAPGSRPGPRPGGGPRYSQGGSSRGRQAQPGSGAMSRDEAWAVLGLAPGAPETAIRDAHRRLMRVSHPDNGGSDWLASRLNQARDVLLGPAAKRRP